MKIQLGSCREVSLRLNSYMKGDKIYGNLYVKGACFQSVGVL